jgi:hypothetical protein
VPPFRGAEPKNPCPLIVHRDDYFPVGSRLVPPSSESVVTGIIARAGVGALGGAVYCSLTCDSYTELKTGGLIAGGLLLLIIAAVRSGARD